MMKNSYSALKAQQQKEVDAFPIVFAFTKEQFAEAMEQLGLKVTDTDKIYSVHGAGFIRKTDSAAFNAMFKRHEQERQAARDNDTTGEGYIHDMFAYELANHEYGYTYDLEPTLDALDLTLDEVKADPRLYRGLKLAKAVITWSEAQ